MGGAGDVPGGPSPTQSSNQQSIPREMTRSHCPGPVCMVLVSPTSLRCLGSQLPLGATAELVGVGHVGLTWDLVPFLLARRWCPWLWEQVLGGRSGASFREPGQHCLLAKAKSG